MNTHAKSNLYAAAQFVLIVAFAVVFIFKPGPAVFVSMNRAGDVFCIAGLLLMAAALASLRGLLQVQPEPKVAGRLVTSGVYARFRHPMYSGVVLLVVGLFLREPALYVAFAGAVIIANLILKSRFEEQLLRDRYPDYDAYRKRSWGVFPGL